MSVSLPIAALLETPASKRNLTDTPPTEEAAASDDPLFEALVNGFEPPEEATTETPAPPLPEVEIPQQEAEVEVQQPAPTASDTPVTPADAPDVAPPLAASPPEGETPKPLPQSTAEQFTLLSQTPPPGPPRTEGAMPPTPPPAAQQKTDASVTGIQPAKVLAQGGVPPATDPTLADKQTAQAPQPSTGATGSATAVAGPLDGAKGADPQVRAAAPTQGAQTQIPQAAAPLPQAHTPPGAPIAPDMQDTITPRVPQDTLTARATLDAALAPAPAKSASPVPMAPALPAQNGRELRQSAPDKGQMLSELRLTQAAAPAPPMATAPAKGPWTAQATPGTLGALGMVSPQVEGREKSTAPQQSVFSEVWGTGAAADTSGTLRPAPPHSPAMIQHIARQLAEALPTQQNQQVSISLNPDELGRVRMALSPGDGAITVNILAERPETLDLLRRNIGDLAREFQDMGFENITFSFDQSAAQTDTDPEGGDPASAAGAGLHLALDEGVADMPAPPQRPTVTTGLDIRL